ncbi:MAG: hypothetical protein JST30_15560 [Armatimonadetes bacterium]|nr:hypothetical protein [Armatimonadota bacterium]
MKGFTQEQLEAARPNRALTDCVAYCLDALFADQTRDPSESVVDGLTFEALIGTLLLARDYAAPMDGFFDDGPEDC